MEEERSPSAAAKVQEQQQQLQEQPAAKVGQLLFCDRGAVREQVKVLAVHLNESEPYYTVWWEESCKVEQVQEWQLHRLRSINSPVKERARQLQEIAGRADQAGGTDVKTPDRGAEHSASSVPNSRGTEVAGEARTKTVSEVQRAPSESRGQL